MRWIVLLALLCAIPGVPTPPRRTVTRSAYRDATAVLPDAAEFARLVRDDPVAALRASVQRYRLNVHGFRAVLCKRERVAGTLGPDECIDVDFRDEPHSVLLKWRTAGLGLADRVLYVEHRNDGQLLARPRNALLQRLTPVVAQAPDGPQARASARLSLRQFGFAKAIERSLTAWHTAQRRGRLRYEYLGETPVPEAGGVRCHVLRRFVDPPEDGVQRITLALDTTNWLPVAHTATGPAGELVASYYFRDVRLNPEFPANHFDPAALAAD